MRDRERLMFESPHDADNTLMFVPNRAGGVIVTTADVEAQDSHNVPISLRFILSGSDALRLRDWLNEWSAPDKP